MLAIKKKTENIKTYGHIDGWAYEEMNRWTGGQIIRRTDRQVDRQTNGQD